MSVDAPKFVGIDFSGDQRQWNPTARASNVWIAVLEEQGANRTLVSLQRVQQLPGQGRPFARRSADREAVCPLAHEEFHLAADRRSLQFAIGGEGSGHRRDDSKRNFLGHDHVRDPQ